MLLDESCLISTLFYLILANLESHVPLKNEIIHASPPKLLPAWMPN